MTSLNIEKALNYLQPEGLLSKSLKGFESREQQQEMMRNILEAYNEEQIALIEAGTGTGKSIAYLIPAILWALENKERTVISTGTIALQEQLLYKDIPLITQALGLEIKAVMVKGIRNYVCKRKLEEAKMEMLLLSSEEAQELQKVDTWAHTTREGSRTSLSFVPTSNTWDKVCAESDTCTGKKCPMYQQCHFIKARQEASDAHLLVVNHHLLFADLTLRADEENYKDPAVLPLYSRVVIDEAHHIEDIATEYFASNLNRLNLLRIMGRLTAEKQASSHGKLPLLKERLHQFYRGKSIPSEIDKILTLLTVDLPVLRHDMLTHITNTFDAFLHLVETLLTSNEGESKLRLHSYHHTHPHWIDHIIPQTKLLIETTVRYIQMIETGIKELELQKNEKLLEQVGGLNHEIKALATRLGNACAILHEFIAEKQLPTKVRWIETQRLKTTTNIQLINAELEVAESLAQFLFTKFPTIILCSATLATNKEFSFVRERLGLNLLGEKVVTENIYDSPFNYAQQALLAIPIDIPGPLDPKFNSSASEKIWDAIQASRGNAFVLFTSYSMLKTCYQQLEKRMIDNRYHPLKQGDDNRQSLINRFKNTDRSVLFGTDSFWEGVDVVGESLRCVIIVKLPFQVPSEPIIQARTEAISLKGGDPFSDYSLPNAIVKFKQGFGRLIRNRKDRGCVVCLDTRILTKNYGQKFLNSLPECQQAFVETEQLKQKMTDFYRNTFHLTK